jgi:IS30 family transposase
MFVIAPSGDRRWGNHTPFGGCYEVQHTYCETLFGQTLFERPAEIEDRAVPGHWEGDLITGANDTHIALVERHARFTALAKHISKLPEQLRRSLTWDQGKEMHAHRRFTIATNVQVYFCDPRSPWQRGSNENTNGLLRQYFPRGTDFSCLSQSCLNAIALRLNLRPRKTLGFETPADRLQAVLR